MNTAVAALAPARTTDSPAAGYYEWLRGEDADGKPFKQPYYMRVDCTIVT